MSRPRSFKTDDLIVTAMRHFWANGYHATSMDDLVRVTGISRHGIYSNIGGKEALYARGFAAYRTAIVDPALVALDGPDAGLEAIASYFETQISLAETVGLPGPGCFVANAETETAPHMPAIAVEVSEHHRRLKDGFARAIGNAAEDRLSREEVSALAAFVATTAQGLWSMSRNVSSAAPLRAHAQTLMSLIETRIGK